MTDKSNRVITIVVGAMLGMLISGVLCFPVWYFVNDNFPASGFMAHVPILAGIIGFGFGAVGGFIIGLVVTAGRLGKIASVLAGLVINGSFPLIFVMLNSGNNTPHKIQREFYFDSIGQACVGMVVGLFVSVFAGYMERRQPKIP